MFQTNLKFVRNEKIVNFYSKIFIFVINNFMQNFESLLLKLFSLSDGLLVVVLLIVDVAPQHSGNFVIFLCLFTHAVHFGSMPNEANNCAFLSIS